MRPWASAACAERPLKPPCQFVSWLLWCLCHQFSTAFLPGPVTTIWRSETLLRRHGNGTVMGFSWLSVWPCRYLQIPVAMAWGLLHQRESHLTMGTGRTRIQGGDAQCRAAPAASTPAYWSENETRASFLTTSHWLRMIAHRARPCVHNMTIPQQWHIETTISLPSARKCSLSTTQQAAAAVRCTA